MTIPNLITVMRLVLVPVVAWALLAGEMGWAFAGFIVAGVSDAVDGFIARHFNQQSALGAYLDPIADKALLVSVFVVLGLMRELPLWLVIAAVSRDLLILFAVALSSVMAHPVQVKPLFVSKANTAVQILLAAVVLAKLAVWPWLGPVVPVLVWLSAILTAASAAAYGMAWLKHMSGHGAGESSTR